MAKIFLSYAREDVDAAKQLAGCIASAGHEVWWDRHIQGGSRFTNEIDRALKDAEVVIVLWSDASVESAWVQDEAAEGRDTGRLVPVILGGCRPPLGFRQFHSIDLGKWDGRGDPDTLGEVIAAIGKTAAPVPPAPEAAPKAAVRDHKASVCVLPFVNMSGDPEQEYFSDGITEDIITDLSKVSALLVIARNTSFTFKGKVMDVKDVAKALDVSHVLEGSVRKAGDRVRITGQLIDAATGGHVWADRYDRDLTDIFAIQDEISKAIVAALRVKLLPDEKRAIATRGTTSVEAYNLYLMARQQWVSDQFGSSRREEGIVRICRQAVTIDPHYAQAWALMALAQAELRFWHGTDADPRPAAERALEIDPTVAEAHCVKARFLESEGRAEEADKALHEALRLAPNSWEVNREAANLIFKRGRTRESGPYFEKAAEILDNDFRSSAMLITCYLGMKDEQAACNAAKRTIERAEAAVAIDSTNGSALAAGASALVVLGETERAKDWIQRALLLEPDNLWVLYNLACGLTFRESDFDAALDLLGQWFERIDSQAHIRHADVDPDMDPIRDDPRFKAMLAAARQRLGISEKA